MNTLTQKLCFRQSVVLYSQRNSVFSAIRKFGVSLESDEIFVSDGAKSDLGNILDVLGRDNSVMIPDPVYPVYVDTNVMDGRKIIFADATAENGFLPMPEEEKKRISFIFVLPTTESIAKGKLK